MKKTKIIATMWPAINSENQIVKAFKAGVNVIRFNFSHARYEETLKTVEIINKLNQNKKTNISLLLDTKGPEIRVWDLNSIIKYKKGQVFKIYGEKKLIDESSDIWIDYPYIIEDLKIWSIIIIDSWSFRVKVISKSKQFLIVKSLNSWEVSSRRHVNLPWIPLKFTSLSSKDIADIQFAAENNFHFIAASFVRNAWDVKEIREVLKKSKKDSIKVISKIENQEWIDNLEEITNESDGIMVARWDLWIEVPIQKLWRYQKNMIDICREKGKIVIVATHFLESMISLPFPTRAETWDIFNTVCQKPDSIMLSWETAVGKYPIQSIKMMSKVIQEAEKSIEYTPCEYSNYWLRETDIEKKLLIKSWIYLGEDIKAKALIVFTKTWRLAKLSASFRPKLPIYAFTKFIESEKYINLMYNVTPFFLPEWNQNNYNDNLENSLKFLIKEGKLNKKDKIIVINDLQKSKTEIPVLEIIHMNNYI